jgi:hypothetical protein
MPALLPLAVGYGLSKIFGGGDAAAMEKLSTDYINEQRSLVNREQARQQEAQQRLYNGLAYETMRRKLLMLQPPTVGGTLKTSGSGVPAGAYRGRGAIGG